VPQSCPGNGRFRPDASFCARCASPMRGFSRCMPVIVAWPKRPVPSRIRCRPARPRLSWTARDARKDGEDVWVMDGSASGLSEVLGVISLKAMDRAQSEIGYLGRARLLECGHRLRGGAGAAGRRTRRKARTIFAEVFQDNPGIGAGADQCRFRISGRCRKLQRRAQCPRADLDLYPQAFADPWRAAAGRFASRATPHPLIAGPPGSIGLSLTIRRILPRLMKFLDLAKVYIRSGGGGGAACRSGARSSSNSAALTAATAAMAVRSGPRRSTG
jgi:hypothetical protein